MTQHATLNLGMQVPCILGWGHGVGSANGDQRWHSKLAKAVPGVSSVVVENMPGAGTLVAAGYVYNVAKPDGLTVGMIHGNTVLQEVLGGQGIQFESRKFNWVVSPAANHYVCALTKASGVDSAAQWLVSKKPLKLGATAAGDSTADVPRILNSAIGFPMKVVDGHKGTPEIALGVLRGDLDGVCMSLETLSLAWVNALKDGDMRVVIQIDSKKHPSLPNVPLASDLAKSEEGRQLIDLGIASLGRIGRLFTLPPGTPKDRVEIIRKAFTATLKDPEFLAEMNKVQLPVDPVSAEEIGEIVIKLHKMPPELLKRMKELLLPKA